MSIDTVSIRGGTAPWIQAVVEWTGDSATWRLVNTTTQTLLYYGANRRYDMATTPETIYHLDLADDIGTHQPFAYVAPPISAPVSLQIINITDASATLVWNASPGATSYVVTVDGEPTTVTAPTLSLTGLEQERSYSVTLQAIMGTAKSLVSPVQYFTTLPTTIAEASQYEYVPETARTYRAGGWTSDADPLIHGSGEPWGNTNGIHTTVFVYSADTLSQMHALAGVRVESMEVSISRLAVPSDARMVLSHWLLHNMTEIPAGAPSFIAPGMGLDSGSLALGQQAWMPLPVGWADALINGSAAGIAWGGVTGRYMIGQPLTEPLAPANGTLRITVG